MLRVVLLLFSVLKKELAAYPYLLSSFFLLSLFSSSSFSVGVCVCVWGEMPDPRVLVF